MVYFFKVQDDLFPSSGVRLLLLQQGVFEGGKDKNDEADDEGEAAISRRYGSDRVPAARRTPAGGSGGPQDLDGGGELQERVHRKDHEEDK
jgi:hypothetical protein